MSNSNREYSIDIVLFIVDQEFSEANLLHANKTPTSQDWFIATNAKQ